ncbi:MAG: SusC/RagA family protein, partial [Bacteroidales bacterium]|nr:SusC/RagA family protein [Bacteroidales bacterium]
VDWKGISFSFILTGVGKRDVWRMDELFYPQYNQYSTIFKSQLNYWTPEHTDSYFPRLYQASAGNTGANTMTQTRYLQSGAYLEIQNITLSYSFPKKWINKAMIQDLMVYFSGENLYTFDHMPQGMSPERVTDSEMGARGFTYPYMRQYSFGINITF